MDKNTNTPNVAVKKLTTVQEAKPKKKTSGKRNRTAGHTWERDIVSALKQIGFEHACTSRSESRSRDDQKIDIINRDERKNGRLPYNIQCKNVVGTLKYAKVLTEMPLDGSEINVVLHNQTKRAASNFITVGQYAFLDMKDFFRLVHQLEILKKKVLNSKH